MYAVCTKGGTGVNNLLLPDPQLCHMTLVCHKHHCFSEMSHHGTSVLFAILPSCSISKKRALRYIFQNKM